MSGGPVSAALTLYTAWTVAGWIARWVITGTPPWTASRLPTSTRARHPGGRNMAKQFTTAKRSRKVIEFDLDEDRYHFTGRKIAGVLLPMLDGGSEDEGGEARTADMTTATWEWLRDGLPHRVRDDVAVEEGTGTEFGSLREALDAGWQEDDLYSPEYDRIMGRLRDPEDDLDVTDVAQVVRWLIGQVSGRPTAPRRG